MPVVTGVLERRGKAKVFVDGEQWSLLDAGVAAERGLREGADLSKEELREARVAGERPLAMDRALGALGYRGLSTAELRGRLLRSGFAAETVEEVIARLAELGYLDDEEFAREFARSKSKRYGPRRVLVDLRRAGIEDEVARGAVEEEFASFSELEAALELVSRRYNMGEDPDAQARRVHGFLMRRGYSAEICTEVARRYHRGTGE